MRNANKQVFGKTKNLGLYLHIPFCRSKCLYCDFCSFPRPQPSVMEAYTEVLIRDLKEKSSLCGDYIVDTVYFGGGTPTVLPPHLLERILRTVFDCYRVSSQAEITAECNPATQSEALFLQMRAAGFNRLSIGMQSAHSAELRALGRIHTFADCAQTVAEARRAGFENLSLDVMFGIPEQTEESFLQTLDMAMDLDPAHISAYGLIIEEGTPFYRMESKLNLPDEDASERMYFQLIEHLGARGWKQYEISNFAKEGYESRHNLKYWRCEEYLGFGPAAHSDFCGVRFGNSRDLTAYIEGGNILEEQNRIDIEERKNEYVMLGMRLAEGVCAKAFEERFGEPFEDRFGARLRRYVEGGFVRLSGSGAAFTPRGMYVSNAILSDILDFPN